MKLINSKETKGEAGEDYIDEAAKIFGWQVIKFDWWQGIADRLYYKNGKSLLIQQKYKEPRTAYPDTGLEKNRYLQLKHMSEETGLRALLLFTDKSCEVYGEFLENLKEETHGGEHNFKNGLEMIYFWLKDLKKIKELLE